MIIANNIHEKGAGFGGETNIVTMYKRTGETKSLPLLSKREVARKILNEIQGMLEG